MNPTGTERLVFRRAGDDLVFLGTLWTTEGKLTYSFGDSRGTLLGSFSLRQELAKLLHQTGDPGGTYVTQAPDGTPMWDFNWRPAAT